MNQIKHTDLIEVGNPFNEAILGAKQLLGIVNELISKKKIEIQASISTVKDATTNTKEGQATIRNEAEKVSRISKEVGTLSNQWKNVDAQTENAKAAAKEYDSTIKKTIIDTETLNNKSASGKRRATENLTTAEYRKQLRYQQLINAEARATAGTYEKLAAQAALLSFELKKTNKYQIGTPEFKAASARLDEYNSKLKKLDAQHGVFGRSVGHYATAIRNAWTLIGGAIMTVGYAITKFVSVNATLSDSLANVRRTTGMTQKEVEDLNKTLENIDTRTSQTSLLDLAHAAGKLGIAKNDIAGFVKASNMIGVALGKDIGDNEEAINQLGRIVTIYKVDTGGVGLERALLKVGSALKVLGNASVAEESNIIDFTKRLGGIASIADISVDKVMALGATMDILGQTMEVSSTAMNQVWLGMAKSPEKFAKIAGMEVDTFKNLMVKDFNEAFISVANGLNKFGGGMDELTYYFDGLGLDGRRLVSVMTALSKNTELYRKQIEISNKALREGTEIAKQAATQEDTLGGKLQKTGKELVNIVRNTGMLHLLTEAFDSIAGALDKANIYLTLFGQNLGLVSKYNKKYDITSEPTQLIEKYKKLVNLKNKFSGETRFSYSKSDSQNLFREGVERPEIGSNYKKLKDEINFSEWAIKIDKLRQKNQQAIKELTKMEQIRAIAEAEYKNQEDENKKKAIEDYKKLLEDYYQFQLNLGRLTIDQIVEHERQKLIDSGVWRRATLSEQLAWEKKARQEAAEVVIKEPMQRVTETFDNKISKAKSSDNKYEALQLEKDKLFAMLELYRIYELDKSNEYEKTLLKYREAEQEQVSFLKTQAKDYFKFYKELGLIGIKDIYDNEIEKYTKTKEFIEASPITQKLILSVITKRAEETANKVGAETGQTSTVMENGQETVNPDINPSSLGTPSNIDDLVKAMEDSWKDAEEKTKEAQQRIMQATEAFCTEMSILLSSISDSYQVSMENELSAVEDKYDREREVIEGMVDSKTMSDEKASEKKKELDKKQKAEEEKIQKEYAEKQRDISYMQAVINIAMGITNAIAQLGPWAALVIPLIIATGAIQLDTIASQKFAKGGSGEILKGKRHADGGVHLPGIGEAEEGEYFAIINRKSTQKYRKQLPGLVKSINDGNFHEYDPMILSPANDRHVTQLFDKRGMVNKIQVTVNERYGKEMLSQMRRPQTKVYSDGIYTVHETGNYRLKTTRQ
jgi:TP901 family phage tail tape measure protein